MYYIYSASSISYQDTFGKKGFSEALKPLETGSTLITPDYKAYIDAGTLRRMSSIIRMAVCCSKDCLTQAEVQQPKAIVVGTGLGCMQDTEKFLKDVVSSTSELLSPTPFIQSTHNSIAGQLSLILKNHDYNVTHTQNTLSFEHALQDALLCLDEKNDPVLVGAADEFIDTLPELVEKLGYKDILLTAGASFFIVSNKKNEQCKARIVATKAHTGATSVSSLLSDLFKENEIPIDSIDLILYSSLDKNLSEQLNKIFKGKLLLDYQHYSGVYFSNSSFALHLAVDVLENGKLGLRNDSGIVKRILILNNLNDLNFGLTIIERFEA